MPEHELVGKLRAGLSRVLASEARPTFHADVVLATVGLPTRPEAEVVDWLRARGRGLHSSTFRLNLSQFVTKTTLRILQKVLTLS